MPVVTRTIHVKVLTFDPAQGRMIPVPNATLLCEDSGWLWDPDLSTGSPTTDASGLAQVTIEFDDTEENSLNPFFTITIPSASRTVPSSAPADRQITLPDEWVTRHYVNRRIPRITDHTDPNNPLELFVGLHGRLRVSYTDFDSSGKRNPLALPEDTVRIHLADYDDFLWIDFLNPDDVMTGFGFDPKTHRTIRVGEHEEYPYFDVWPTVPCALDGPPPAPRAWLDPPGAPVGTLGGGSFERAGSVAVAPHGSVAVDLHGFVFMVDGNVVRRFYPDGTLCETIKGPGAGFNDPGGLALDQYRNLFVADTGGNRISIFRQDWPDGPIAGATTGRYVFVRDVGSAGSGNGQFAAPRGLAVVPNPVVDDDEFLAVADSDNHRVQVFTIEITAAPNRSKRATGVPIVDLAFLTAFGTAGAGVGQFQKPVGVASDRQRRLFVCDRSLHRVSRWGLNTGVSPPAYAHETDWGKSGGGSGGGDREFDTPEAVAVDTKNGHVYVAESGNGRVQRLDAESGDHLTHWVYTYSPALAGTFTPTSVAADARGEVYATDTANKRVVRATTFDNNGVPLSVNTPPAVVGLPWTPRDNAAHMNGPRYVHYDASGKLWVSDSGNNRVLVFERDPSGELVPAAGPPPAGLDKPTGVARDPEGSLFVVDSGNHRVRRYDSSLAHQADLGAHGSGNSQFDDPRGLAVVQRTEPMLYVADRANNRVQILRRDGTFTGTITAGGGLALSAPEDVAVDSRGNVYVADTGNARIVQFDASNSFVRVATVPAVGSTTGLRPEPCGVSVDGEDKLIVTDRAQNKVLRMQSDGTLLTFWDLEVLLRQDAPSRIVYYPELARLLVFDAPTRAVVDSRGLLAVADTGHDRVRLVRIHTDLGVNLFDLGEGLPDISFRAHTKADWSEDLGLKINVGDVSIFDDSHQFVSEPENNFSADAYERDHILESARHTNAAINVMKVARMVQKWYQHHARRAEPARRWGTRQNVRTLDVDLNTLEGSMYFLDVNLDNEESGSPHGRGADSWDDSVVAHEMSHWVFSKNTMPYPILPLNPWRWFQLSSVHYDTIIGSFNQVLSEGWAEYAEHFWGGEYGSTDRIRGFPMLNGKRVRLYPINLPSHAELMGISESGSPPYQHLFGGPESAAPTFNDPSKGLRSEGYFSNTLYQIHRALTDPGVLFADSPSYWHGYNVHISDEQSQRFSDTIWKALERFQNDPPFSDRASQVFLTKLLEQFHASQPAFAQMAQTIFELNNQLMPTITITEGTSDSSPGTPVGERVEMHELEAKPLIIQVRDATGRPLAGYNLIFKVGDQTDYSFSPGGAGPSARHGHDSSTQRPPPPNQLNRATNEHGIVNLTFEGPPVSPTVTHVEEVLEVVYQPDFDTDTSFEPPRRGDDLETTLRRAYLHELRGAAKSWSGTGNNFGARVSKTVTFDVRAL